MRWLGIGSGQAGGPMAAVGPLVERVLGVEARPITYKKDGMKRSLSIPGVLEQSLEGVPSPVKEGEPLYVDNTLHPANAAPGPGACFGQPPERVRPPVGGCERAEQRALRPVRVGERLTHPQPRLLEPTALVVLGGIAALIGLTWLDLWRRVEGDGDARGHGHGDAQPGPLGSRRPRRPPSSCGAS